MASSSFVSSPIGLLYPLLHRSTRRLCPSRSRCQVQRLVLRLHSLHQPRPHTQTSVVGDRKTARLKSSVSSNNRGCLLPSKIGRPSGDSAIESVSPPTPTASERLARANEVMC